MAKSSILRPPGLIVFAVFVALAALLWLLLADGIVERGVEATGESLVGAQVDLESVDLRLAEGSVRMMGLQVANPEAPMSNLIEAEEILLDLLLEPLLTKKVVVQSMLVTGVRFNTPRETSGALENPDPQAGQLWRNVNAWAEQVRGGIPELSLETLTGTVRTEAISADSLRTVQYARTVLTRADSLRTAWEERAVALDPRPRIDSLRAVVERVEDFRPTPLNALQIPELVRDARGALEDLTSLETEVVELDETIREGVSSIAVGPETIEELRAQDMAYARSLLNIPSLDAPSITPALFGETALTWLKPVLYWARQAERFLPPGLDPRRRPGPQRARAEGTTVEFPGRAEYPAFLLQQGEVGMVIGGSGLAAGAYTAVVRGLTSAPSLLGEPMAIELGRTDAAQGPQGLRLSALLDHTSEPIRDEAAVGLSGVQLPDLDLGPLGGSVSLGLGESTFALQRIGDQIDAELRFVSTDLGWSLPDAATGPAPQVGTAAWARDLVWQTLTGIERVELGMGLEGTIADPQLSVTSNLGEAVAASLRRELGEQIEQAEARLREELDSHIQPVVEDARSRVQAVQTNVVDRVAEQRAEIEELRARLEAEIAELASGLPNPGL